MKRFTLITAFAAVFILGSVDNATAQNGLTTLTYNVSGATGDMKDFVGDTSWLGFQIKGSYFKTENMALGLSFGWQVFDENTNETFGVAGENINGHVTGFQTRYINAFPVMGGVQYFFGESRAVRPYVGFEAGFNYIVQRFDIGVTSQKEQRFHFALAPELGVIVPAGFNSYLVLAGRYDHAFKAGSYVTAQKYDFTYWSVKAGIAWEPGF
jgi:outer membrane protein W